MADEIVKTEPVAPTAVVPPIPPEEKALAAIPEPIESTSQMVQEDDDDIFVAARTLEEMNLAQKKLIAWADKKIEKMSEEIKAAQTNLDLAKKRKWATDSLKRSVASATKKFEFYEKVKAALEAGYTIIPDMPMDVFAVRTTRKNPRRNQDNANTQYGGRAFVKDQVTNNPALGEGKFVRPKATETARSYEIRDKEGKLVPHERRWAVEFMEDIDFPFRLAKPVVLDATAKALADKIFDHIGVAPSTNGGTTTRHRRAKGDPMVIGRIFYRNGYTEKGISFLVSWFIDSKDL